ncbi:hypothetical protein P3T76_001782 [Phytophthora citrophthora]|uniref:Uncharacterized protein n=1 Tax=Phytophthora citrophthora TaxID=4793 RepID=A0AAD9GW49_9STRA|nr:hypothetical protein P3T76_001782 [Phytophthora citrophthora]
MALTGPHHKDLLQEIEKGLRNRYARGGFRLNQHATGSVEDPTNMAETWEFVKTVPGCNGAIVIFDALCVQLNAVREATARLVQEKDELRAEEIAVLGEVNLH